MSHSVAELVVKNQTLRWSSPSQLNDPGEFKIAEIPLDRRKYIVEAALMQLQLLLKKEIEPQTEFGLFQLQFASLCGFTPEQAVDELKSAIEDSVSTFFENQKSRIAEFHSLMERDKILCLTDDPRNPVMWAHYAANYSGAVLGFRTIKLFDSPYSEARPVRYVAGRPYLYTEDELAGVMVGTHKTDKSEMLDRIVLSKLDRWSYEREWRVFTAQGRTREAEYEDLPFHRQELASVIFGPKMNQEARFHLMRTVSEKYDSVRFFCAKISGDGRIIVEPTADDRNSTPYG